MPNKQSTSPKVRNTDPKKARGTKPGDKVVNRRGGGAPPPSIITNMRKVDGIRGAIKREIEASAAWVILESDENCFIELAEMWVDYYLGERDEMPQQELWNQVMIFDAFVNGFFKTPDALRVRDGLFPGISVEGFKEVFDRVALNHKNQQSMHQEIKLKPKTKWAPVHVNNPNIKVLGKVDNSNVQRVLQATRR